LRHELTSTVGVEWEPVHNGVAEILGFDREVLRHFSRRTEEIRDRVSEMGYRSVRAWKLATLETRRLKEHDVPADRLREEWRPGGRRYSTPEMLNLERRLVDDAHERKDQAVALADAATVERAIGDRPLLADEQADLVRSLTLSGDGVQIVRAAAGTGKTYALA